MDVKYFQDFKLGYLYSPKGISLYDEFFQLNYQPGYRPTKEDMSDLASYLPNWQTPYDVNAAYAIYVTPTRPPLKL